MSSPHSDVAAPLVETFPALDAIDGLIHGFILRHPSIPVDTERETALERLETHYESVLQSRFGIAMEDLWTGEQIHGDRVAACPSAASSGRHLPETDGLVTGEGDCYLGIYVADCCAVFLADPDKRVCALVHSGKNGSALGIAPAAIRKMGSEFGSDPESLTVQLSPCIRPPAYEIDFAARIRDSCESAGVPGARIHDSGICTSGDLDRYYSYRTERGKTGRMLAVIGWRNGGKSDEAG